MKICPYCSAENRDDTAICYFCGNRLNTWKAATTPAAAESNAEPTQPVHLRRPPRQARYIGPNDTQQVHQNTAPTLYPQSTASYPSSRTPPPVQIPPPPVPPPTPLAGSPSSSHLLPVLVLGLAAVLLFACGFAMWTLTSATSSAAERLRAELATQAADVFPPAATPLPAEAELPAQPTSWPTFTPQPQPVEPPDGAGLTPTPDPTQVVIIEKLLSEGCSNALENLRMLSDQAKSQPTVAFDAQWRENLNLAVADMKTNCGTLDAASPVPGLISQAHQDLASAQSEFDQAGKLFDEGVRDLAPGKLLEAAQHIQQAVKYLNQAITELRKIGNN